MRTLIVSLLISTLLSQLLSAGIDFNRDIRPILSDKCFACHGPDAKKRKADLRLDTYADAITDLEGIKAIDPQKLEDSEILHRIATDDSDEIMPPPKANKALSKDEISLLTEWIKSGGKYEAHWSFEPISKPALAEVKDLSWGRNPIDTFVLAKLEEANHKPNPEANKRALIRRTGLDLTGLPPTLQEVDEFLRDDSPDAFEKVIDRFLASPRYGEHMARYWLDAVRYGRHPRPLRFGRENESPLTHHRLRPSKRFSPC